MKLTRHEPDRLPSERVMLIKGLVLLAAVVFDIWAKRRSGTAR